MATSTLQQNTKHESIIISMTIAADLILSEVFTPNIPSGYSIESINLHSDHFAFIALGWALSGGVYRVFVKNVATGERKGNVYVEIVYTK